MNSKKALIALALVFTVLNAGFVFAANEPFKNLHSAFGIEDPDADLDGIEARFDKCPATPFDLFLITESSKKDRALVPFWKTTASGSQKVFLKLKKINKSKVSFQTSADEKFSKGTTKDYTVIPNTITVINGIDKRLKILYTNSGKGVLVAWVADLESGKKGCTAEQQ